MVAAAITMASSPSEIALHAAYQGDLSLLKSKRRPDLFFSLFRVWEEPRKTLNLGAAWAQKKNCAIIICVF
jgi:hypothetical protein